MDKLQERMNRIISLLSASGMLRVAELAQQCDVSEVTIRRDLRRLEDDGLVFLAHGAASINPSSDSLGVSDQYFITKQRAVHPKEKASIGRLASSLIEPDDTIVIDTGTTPYFLARELPRDYNLTVICYSLNAFIELSDREDVTLIFAGGYFHRNTLTCESEEGIEMIRRHRAGKAFLGATGIHEKLGVTSSNPFEQKLKQTVLESSLTNVLLVDSFKFGVVRTSYFADISEFDIVVSDAGLSEDYTTIMQQHGVHVMIAEL